MLLVDDDQPEIARSARTRPSAARRRCAPRPRAAAATRRSARRAQARVQHRDGLAEAFDEAPDDLRRQRDLGHEHDRAATLRERELGGAQVDLGLARAGHPVQQRARARRAAIAARRRATPAPLLLGGQRGGRGLRAPTGQVARRASTARRLRPLSRRVAPGGSTRPSARAIVEQYSAAIHSASATSLGGHAQLERAQRREQLLVRDLAASRRARRRRRGPRGGRTARRASSRRPRRRRAAPPAGGSRTARAARGPSSSALPGRSAARHRRDPKTASALPSRALRL